LQITFRGMPHSDALEAHATRRVAKLDRFFDRITSCRVVIESTGDHQIRHHRHGRRFHVSIDIVVPRSELAIAKSPPDRDVVEDPHSAMESAFDDAERRLEDWSQRIRGEVKSRHLPPVGRVTKIFGDRGFGFLESEEGEEIYFHRNSVLRAAFGALAPGVLVRYREESGDDGPQASTVEVVG